MSHDPAFRESMRRWREYLRRRSDIISSGGHAILESAQPVLERIEVPDEHMPLDYKGPRWQLCALLEAAAIFAFRRGIADESFMFFAGQRMAEVRGRLSPTCKHPSYTADSSGRWCASCYVELGDTPTRDDL